jgi:hypothetical protein
VRWKKRLFDVDGEILAEEDMAIEPAGKRKVLVGTGGRCHLVLSLTRAVMASPLSSTCSIPTSDQGSDP